MWTGKYQGGRRAENGVEVIEEGGSWELDGKIGTGQESEGEEEEGIEARERKPLWMRDESAV